MRLYRRSSADLPPPKGAATSLASASRVHAKVEVSMSTRERALRSSTMARCPAASYATSAEPCSEPNGIFATIDDSVRFTTVSET